MLDVAGRAAPKINRASQCEDRINLPYHVYRNEMDSRRRGISPIYENGLAELKRRKLAFFIFARLLTAI